MKKRLLWTAMLLAAALLLRCVPTAQLQRFFEATLRFSAQSIFPYSYTAARPPATASTPTQGAPTVELPPVANDATTATDSVVPQVAADPAKALGRVVRKALPPYGANTAYNGVYVSNKTGTALDISANLQKAAGFTLKGDGRPEILLYHTHATECYLPEARDFYTAEDATRSRDPQQNVLAVGQVIQACLQSAGFGVVHNTTLHDAQAYSGSYDRSEQTVKACLEQYPSIQLIIDLHRDSISADECDKVAPVVQLEGKSAAQVMLCIASGTGGIANFENWQKNLPFALRLQQLLEQQAPGLARSALFLSQRYNQHLASAALLIEVGSEANSLQEALYSAELLGKALAQLCTTLKE